MSNPTIVSAIVHLPETMFDMAYVSATMSDGSEVKKVFDFFPDEIAFTAAEFSGLTITEALDLKARKDTAYLQG
jgi:hypothetical protein